MRPALGVERGRAQRDPGPASERPSLACSARAPLGQAAASTRRALRPQRPRDPSRDRRGRRPGRGRGRGAGLPAAPGAAGSFPGAPSALHFVCY